MASRSVPRCSIWTSRTTSLHNYFHNFLAGDIPATMEKSQMKHAPTLASLAEDLAHGRTSARKLVDDCLTRIGDAAGEGIRTFIHVDKEAALEAAEAMDKLRSAKAAP